MKKSIVALTVTTAAAVVFSAQADATPQQDEAFCAYLTDLELPCATNGSALAAYICDEMWSGVDPYAVVNDVYQANRGLLSYDQADEFTRGAVSIYCPPRGLNV